MNIRTSKPSAGNKFYITKSKGGWSSCIVGKPTDVCNVLANCVGYACGRFNEIIGSMKYPSLNCNAENFIERAKSLGLKISDKPTLGGIMVWQKGSTLKPDDGAGHVAIVERIDSSNQIYTSESGYNSKAFWNTTRTNNNGRWSQGSGYKFRGCIINPSVSPTPTPTKKYIEITATAGVWCRLNGYGFKYSKYKVIPYKTKCELITKNVGSANGYKWDKVIYNSKTVYLPNKWNKYL